MQRTWLNLLRERRIDTLHRNVESELKVAVDRPERPPGAERLLSRVEKAILTLPDTERQVYSLICVDGLSYAEAAKALQRPLSAVRYRLVQARLRLRAELLNVMQQEEA